MFGSEKSEKVFCLMSVITLQTKWHLRSEALNVMPEVFFFQLDAG